VPGVGNKGRTFRAEVLSRAEADALIGACSPASRTGIRNRAILTVPYQGGMRAFSIRETLDVDHPMRSATRWRVPAEPLDE
jgi:hypothetical protein